MNKTYICIDLKSFYASVECIERNLDPMTTNLVVADPGRTEKTICLAVSPSLKSYGIPGRARLFEVIGKVREVNYQRRKNAYHYKFTGKSYNDKELKKNKKLTKGSDLLCRYKIMIELYNVLFEKLSARINGIYEVATKPYIAIKTDYGKNIAEIRIQSIQIKITIYKPKDENNLIGESLNESYTWVHNYVIYIKKLEIVCDKYNIDINKRNPITLLLLLFLSVSKMYLISFNISIVSAAAELIILFDNVSVSSNTDINTLFVKEKIEIVNKREQVLAYLFFFSVYCLAEKDKQSGT